ncbi:RHS repeat-associated core domain-containing protein [Kitasatospora sp. NPDC015120]|uniref:RHS repeat-associated core domain-containing protein n=1 Tax=Kitasatospora sp. NPDC015120 TaxID=3364023 RepID=UPI0036F475AA
MRILSSRTRPMWRTAAIVALAMAAETATVVMTTGQVMAAPVRSGALSSASAATAPATPLAWAVSPESVHGPSGVHYTTSATPTLRAKAVDADGGTYQAQFEITADPAFGDTTYSYTANSAPTASGVNALYTVPVNQALPDGKHLRLRARAFDGTDYSDWTAYTPFVVDTTRPAAATVSCAGYGAGTWTAPQSGGAVCTLDTTSTDGQGYAWGMDDEGTPERLYDTADGTDGDPLQLTVDPAAGWHTLYVRSIDAAGNLTSAATAYSFGIGADGAALLTPSEGDRPARTVTLTAIGRTSYTGATYEYRLGDTDSWKTVPAGDVTAASNGGAVSWPVAVASGQPAALTWNLTGTLPKDSTVQIRARFTDGTNTGYSQTTSVIVDRNAGTAPLQGVGPGSLNSLTGDYTLSGADVSVFGLAVNRTASSRRPAAGGAQEGQVAIFGPEWTAGTTAAVTASAWSYVQQTSATSVAVVRPEGIQVNFTAAAGGAWVPETGAESLSLTGSLTGSFTLKDTEGVTSTFSKVDASSTVWNASTSYRPTGESTTTVVSETVVSGSTTLARPKYVIAPSTAVTNAACQAAPATAGCRVLEYVYATGTTATSDTPGDYLGRVSQIKLWATDPGASAATATAVVQYAYDTAGRLSASWDPRLTTPLKAAYTYDSAGRVTTLTTAGELPWTFTYGTVGSGGLSGPGMLLSVSRPTLTPGTTATVNGTATSSVVYHVPLTGAKAPLQMGAADVRAWNQKDVPATGTAFFPADQVPASANGADLNAGDYTRATILYTNASGRLVNSAEPGGHISTTQYDRFGNTVRTLGASNRSLALGLTPADTAAQAELGIAGLSSAERAELLGSYNYYNGKGTRLLEEFGPLHTVELTKDFKSGTTVLAPAGSTVAARSWKVNEYDVERPTDGSATVQDQLTTTTAGLRVNGYDSLLTDKRVTYTQYDWAKGLPKLVTQDSGGLALTTGTVYDAQGRVIGVQLPGSTGGDAAAKVTVYWDGSGTTSDWCKGRPEWAGLICWTGPAGDITGGGGNPNTLVDSTITYNRYGKALTTVDTSGSAYRTTAITYDAADRVVTTKITGNQGQAVPEVTQTYDPQTGRLLTSASTLGGTITHGYDKLGRQISYTDADGATTNTSYDALDRPLVISDSVPSTVTYSYDTAKEPRGVPVGLTDSVAGTFTATYTPDGALATEKLPGGYTLTRKQDPSGATVARTYTRDSDGAVVLADSIVQSVHGQVTTHSSSNGVGSVQRYAYDGAGRLSEVKDTTGGVCTLRTYTLDKRANRVAQSTATGAAGAACPTSGATTNHTYDSADRLTDTGYAYDAFGRTTTLPGTTNAYFTNDLVQQQTTGSKRTTWTLDSNQRFRTAKAETSVSGTWSTDATSVNHYSADNDTPRWITEDAAGNTTRNVSGLGSGVEATTTATGSPVLLFTNIHGDVSLRVPLTAGSTPTATDTDEFGNLKPGAAGGRYGYLGAYQRSTSTPAGVTLMGVRLYNPATGRFLSTDPVHGGNANAYEYCSGDPVNCTDLDGRWSASKTRYYSWGSVSGRYWSASSWTGTGWGGATATANFNRLWTWRIGNYGWYSYLIIGGITGLVSALAPPAAPAAIAIGALVSMYWGTIQLIANWASNTGKCLGIGSGAAIYHRYYVPIYASGAYGIPYRRNC